MCLLACLLIPGLVNLRHLCASLLTPTLILRTSAEGLSVMVFLLCPWEVIKWWTRKQRTGLAVDVLFPKCVCVGKNKSWAKWSRATNQLDENLCETLWFAFSSKRWIMGCFCPFLVIGTNVRFASDKRLLWHGSRRKRGFSGGVAVEELSGPIASSLGRASC